MTAPLVQLTREIRFFLPRDVASQNCPPVLNSWSGWPTGVAVAPFFGLQCTLEGPIDPRTDYVCNVKQVDALLRAHVIALIWARAVESSEYPSPAALLAECWRLTEPSVPAGTHLQRMRLCVSPFLSFSFERTGHPMIQVIQQFEFSASHRLHNSKLSDEENRRLYGKCNNPHGHGHNYVLEVALEIGPEAATTYSTTTTEEFVKRTIIDRLDHRHLNIEVSPFDRLNPTVENIAVTIWDWLIADFPSSMRLARVRVYETPKTWADYSGARE
jgi:6-pyruvoyltetrahydropterin/6-carboxytetrahydropterin synthase